METHRRVPRVRGQHLRQTAKNRARGREPDLGAGERNRTFCKRAAISGRRRYVRKPADGCVEALRRETGEVTSSLQNRSSRNERAKSHQLALKDVVVQSTGCGARL